MISGDKYSITRRLNEQERAIESNAAIGIYTSLECRFIISIGISPVSRALSC
ncbi:MAG: hypothetical protein ACI9LM_004365 [Alteromonadaceae bacterium]|jgi:hypothetical protein